MGSSWTRNLTHVFCIGRWILYHWATRENPLLLPFGVCSEYLEHSEVWNRCLLLLEYGRKKKKKADIAFRNIPAVLLLTASTKSYLLLPFSLVVLPKNWVWLLVGVKRQNQARLKEGRIYYCFQQIKTTLGIFPKAVSPWKRSWGSFKLRVHAYSSRGLSSGEFSIESEQRLTGSKV